MNEIINIEDFNIKSVKFSDWEYAWKISDVLTLLDLLFEKKYVVLGGDILTDRLEHNYDSWYYEPNDENSTIVNTLESYNIAYKYIKNYIERNGISFYVILVVEKGTQ